MQLGFYLQLLSPWSPYYFRAFLAFKMLKICQICWRGKFIFWTVNNRHERQNKVALQMHKQRHVSFIIFFRIPCDKVGKWKHHKNNSRLASLSSLFAFWQFSASSTMEQLNYVFGARKVFDSLIMTHKFVIFLHLLLDRIHIPGNFFFHPQQLKLWTGNREKFSPLSNDKLCNLPWCNRKTSIETILLWH